MIDSQFRRALALRRTHARSKVKSKSKQIFLTWLKALNFSAKSPKINKLHYLFRKTSQKWYELHEARKNFR